MIFYDTETCGLHGPLILVQYGEAEGPVTLHHVWERPAKDTLDLIEMLMDQELCAWNIRFDHFHLQRAYNVLRLLDPNQVPSAEAWARAEAAAIDGPCVKPRQALDLMIHAQKGPLQALMERKPIRIRRVPRELAPALAAELGTRIEFDSIYFKRRRAGYEWQVVEDDEGGLPDVVLRFGASSRLKDVANHLLGVEVFDLPVPKEWMPKGERSWFFHDPAPWLALGPDGQTRVIDYQIKFWSENQEALRYARQDVEILRALWTHFGKPEAGDDNSVLACQVASARHRGYAFDPEKLDQVHRRAVELQAAAPTDWRPVKAGLLERLSEIEIAAARIEDTSNATLARIIKNEDLNDSARGFARAVSAARSAAKVVDLCEKLKLAGRAHADFRVLGTLSDRMSGAGKLSMHQIPKKGEWKVMREMFTLADRGMVLEGGDWDSFEVGIMAATYSDDGLTDKLKQGGSFHKEFGESVYGRTISKDEDEYGKAKAAVFASAYGAQAQKIAETLGLSEEKAEAGLEDLLTKYPGIREEKDRLYDDFCSMRQPGGLGSRVEWHEPAEYVESLLGHRRYFTLENAVAKALFELAQNPPDRLRSATRVERRAGRVQTSGGAVQSALYGCAFQIQAAVLRQAGNHRIQATGAGITKRLQRYIWDQQPHGVTAWYVQPLNVHDEVQTPCVEGLPLDGIVRMVIEEFKHLVPLLAMTWDKGCKYWGDSK